jgi:hypothetical protein
MDKLRGKPPRPEHSRRYERYLQYAERHASVLVQLAKSTEAGERSRLSVLLDQISNDWLNKGHKKEIEQALTTVRAISSTNPEQFWARVSAQFRANRILIGGIAYPNTRFKPDPKTWLAADGWYSWSANNSHGQLKWIEIHRDWLEPSVLNGRSWSWTDGPLKKEGILVSDGFGLTTGKSVRPPLMSLVPIKLLLAKDVITSGQLITAEPMIVGVICETLPRSPR